VPIDLATCQPDELAVPFIIHPDARGGLIGRLVIAAK
jgi:hypothetical protein